jgi:hypothetical protein
MHLQKIEQSLINQLETGSDYIQQSPLSMINFGRGNHSNCSEEEIKTINQYLLPNSSRMDFENWRMKHAISFFSASAWIEHLKRFDFVIGVRIHGVMLALQAGVPAICIVHDSRTRELCQTMLVPYIEASELNNGFSKSEILDRFLFNADAFTENRKLLAKRYVEFLTSNELKYSKYLRDII